MNNIKNQKKRIAFDIPHIVDFNLLKNAIIILDRKKEYEITVYTLNRGKLNTIVKSELPPSIKIIKLGKWGKNILYKIFVTNLLRSIQFCLIFKKKRPSIGISPGSLPFSFALRIFHVKDIQFSDDIERWFLLFLEGLFSTEKYCPNVSKRYSNMKFKRIPMLKQWAYLSLKYFTPNNNVLEKYGLEPNKYLFVREIRAASTNYRKQKNNLISKIANKFPKDYKVVLSLEDKSVSNYYPKDWIILREPIEYFHSLIYYSKVLISSGDSMAREGGVLGVPSIYCGLRHMEANKILQKKGMLLHIQLNEVPEILDKIVKNEMKFEYQEIFRNQLSYEFVELTDLIVERTESHLI